MKASESVAAFAAGISLASAAFQGFNYGSTFTTGAPKQKSDFEAEFRTAQSLVGAPAGGFHSARLYTMVQAGTANDPISALPAAVATKTSLLLGIWASAGDAAFAMELQALKSAIARYGATLTPYIAGLSLGSEDLYRISPTGLLNKENPGAQPDTLIRYIMQVREALAGTPWAGVKIGHVDTWTAWVNASNAAVAKACDWVGMDAYPYFQDTMQNDIASNRRLFLSALQATQVAVSGKEVWVTETGFPVRGKTIGNAVPSLENARRYWVDVGCALFGTTNTWWYTMQDAAPETPNPSFGLIGRSLTTIPLYDVSCGDTTVTLPAASSVKFMSSSLSAGASSSYCNTSSESKTIANWSSATCVSESTSVSWQTSLETGVSCTTDGTVIVSELAEPSGTAPDVSSTPLATKTGGGSPVSGPNSSGLFAISNQPITGITRISSEADSLTGSVSALGALGAVMGILLAVST